jgi:hypothetical protein
MFDKRFVTTMMTLAIVLAPIFAAGPSFRPDVTFTGSSLTGWRMHGDADWRAQDGEIVGVPKQPGGGWLVLDRSYQDVGFYASFRCTGGCKPGVLLRAEKTADGFKGVFVSLAEGDIASYAIAFDASGRETKREALRSAGGQVRSLRLLIPMPAQAVAVPVGAVPEADAARARSSRLSRLRTLAVRRLEFDRDPARRQYRAIVPQRRRPIDRRRCGGCDRPIRSAGALAGGTGEVRFKEVGYKDLALKVRPVEEVSNRFRMQRLSDFYYAWGAGAADFNHDGAMDVIAGPHIYFGPDYLKSREIYINATWTPSDTYIRFWMQFVADFRRRMG